jgi:hypothetical protein
VEARTTSSTGSRWIGRAADREVAEAAEEVVAQAASRARLAAVEVEILELRADDGVPARGRRLLALEQARADLRAELGEPALLET